MSFSARRAAKPRKIAIAESDSEEDDQRPRKPTTLPLRKKATAATSTSTSSSAPAIATSSAALKKRPGGAPARLSFNDPGSGGADGDASTTTPFAPKKSALSRKAIERNAARKLAALPAAAAAAPTPERVSYSKEYMAELRSAQQTAPPATEEEDAVMVDLDGATTPAMVGGSDSAEVETGNGNASSSSALVAPAAQTTQIMDPALVRVMKERRRERAAAAKVGAKDFISLHDDDGDASGSNSDDGEGTVLRIKKQKKKKSRLALPNDDEGEEIGNYADDSGMLEHNATTERRLRRQAIRATLAEVEPSSDADDDDDNSDASAVGGWERAQISKGAFSSEHNASRGLEGELEALARNPPAAVLPLPEIGDVVARLEATLRAMQLRKAQTERQVETLVAEKREIREREGMVQARLKEAAEKYEQLRKEAGIAGGEPGSGSGVGAVMDRGLESFGNTPIRAASED